MLTRAKTVIRTRIPGDLIMREARSDSESDSEEDERGNLKGLVEYVRIPIQKPVDHKSIDKL